MSNDNNVRMSIVIPAELRTKLEKAAAADNRSTNNYIVNVLMKAVTSNES